MNESEFQSTDGLDQIHQIDLLLFRSYNHLAGKAMDTGAEDFKNILFL